MPLEPRQLCSTGAGAVPAQGEGGRRSVPNCSAHGKQGQLLVPLSVSKTEPVCDRSLLQQPAKLSASASSLLPSVSNSGSGQWPFPPLVSPPASTEPLPVRHSGSVHLSPVTGASGEPQPGELAGKPHSLAFLALLDQLEKLEKRSRDPT